MRKYDKLLILFIMGDISINSLFQFLIFLGTPFFFAAIVKKLKLSPIIGYIIGGLFLGNVITNFSHNPSIESFAYFGIALLLFTVGLELNFSRILILKKFIVIGGSLQILLSILMVTLFSQLFGFPILESFLIGIALSSSSTTLVAKIIQDRGEESSFLGEIAMGILLFQDIAFIPFLIIFTSITSKNLSFIAVTGDIIISMVKSTVIIASLYYFGKKIIPMVFSRIAKASRELFNIFIILFIIFIAYLSVLLGVPILIGTFVAGVLLAQTTEHYHIFSEVRPFRDLLAVIFFIYIGTNIKLGLIVSQLPMILLFTAGVIIIKALIILIIFLRFKFHSKTSFNIALYLFQIDEDAFILMSTAYVNKVIGISDYLFVISSTLISLLLTPILIKNKDKIYLGIRKIIKTVLPFVEQYISHRIDSNQSPLDSLTIKNHVVICGYGRVGSYIGRSLMMANIPFIAIDYNLYIVEKAKKEGVNIIYGDPTDIDILDYAQVDEALIIVMAVPERYSQEAIILNAKKLNKNISIVSRVHNESDQRRMKDLGVDVVVQPEFEASLSIIKKIYLWHSMEKNDIMEKIRRLKIEHGIL